MFELIPLLAGIATGRRVPRSAGSCPNASPRFRKSGASGYARRVRTAPNILIGHDWPTTTRQPTLLDRHLNNFPISRGCHSRMLLAGIQRFKACGCPIKALGHDDHLGKLFNRQSLFLLSGGLLLRTADYLWYCSTSRRATTAIS